MRGFASHGHFSDSANHAWCRSTAFPHRSLSPSLHPGTGRGPRDPPCNKILSFLGGWLCAASLFMIICQILRIMRGAGPPHCPVAGSSLVGWLLGPSGTRFSRASSSHVDQNERRLFSGRACCLIITTVCALVYVCRKCPMLDALRRQLSRRLRHACSVAGSAHPTIGKI